MSFPFRVLYPKRLNLIDFCAKNWRISSLKILDRTPAMPFSPPLSGSFIDLSIGLVHYITETTFSHASTFTNFFGTSYRPIQNVPSIRLNIPHKNVIWIEKSDFNNKPGWYLRAVFNREITAQYKVRKFKVFRLQKVG